MRNPQNNSAFRLRILVPKLSYLSSFAFAFGLPSLINVQKHTHKHTHSIKDKSKYGKVDDIQTKTKQYLKN